MSMLAGPKRKKQYVLNPRGKPLYNDDDRFGSKMLQKMGWTKGKGLGAKESGNVNFVRVNFKCDAAGLGFEDRNDQWTQHEKGFSGLLKALHEENVNGGNNDNKEGTSDNGDEQLKTVGFGFQQIGANSKTQKLIENVSGQSLEERSKQSKARVHYKKYTKGKDLAQYSEKDLANIFGKKAVDHEIEEKNCSNSENENKFCFTIEKIAESKLENVPEVEESVMLKTSSTSIDDYFKNKMLQRKSAKQNLKCEESVAVDNLKTPIVKNKLKTPKNKHFDELDATLQHQTDDTGYFVETGPKKKKKNESGCIVNKDVVTQSDEVLSENNKTTEITSPSCQTQCAAPKQKKNKQKTSIEDLDGYTNKSEVKENGVNMFLEELSVAENEKTTKNKKRKHINDNEVETLDTFVKQIKLNDSKKNKIQQKNKMLTTEEDIKFTKAKPDLNGLTEEVPKSEKKAKGIEENVRFVKVKIANDAKTISNLKEFHQFYCTYQISSFVAEKFRHLDFSKFRNSNLAQLLGYSHDENLKIEIVQNPLDEFRILDLWKRSFDKYSDRKLIRDQGKQAKNSKTTKTVIASDSIKTQKKSKGKKGLNNLKRHKRRNIFKLGV